jgi:GTPase Era involved in 16S rRNA processing
MHSLGARLVALLHQF